MQFTRVVTSECIRLAADGADRDKNGEEQLDIVRYIHGRPWEREIVMTLLPRGCCLDP